MAIEDVSCAACRKRYMFGVVEYVISYVSACWIWNSMMHWSCFCPTSIGFGSSSSATSIPHSQAQKSRETKVHKIRDSAAATVLRLML